MNRAEFMRQLESLLQSIPAAEREEALQYYNDYFDDAGDENEQDVIEALGNPARVAENIKRDLLESGYGEVPPKKAVASDRKLIEYGEAEAQAQSNPAASQEVPAVGYRTAENEAGIGRDNGMNGGTGIGSSSGMNGGTGIGSNSGMNGGIGIGSNSGMNGGIGIGSSSGMNGGTGMGSGVGNGVSSSVGVGSGTGVNNAGGYAYVGSSEVPVKTVKPEKSGWPGWAVALLVVGLVFASPLIVGLIGTLIGVLASWIALILSVGMVTLALFIMFLLLVVVGIMCMFVDPISGVALVGGGLLCGGIGLLFLMLTVAMAGIVTPAIFRGIAFLFGWRKKK